MKEIGGFFGLELSGRKQLHGEAVALNSGRNCLRQIVHNRAIKRILAPYYTSNSVIDAIQAEGGEILFYRINKDFSPILEGHPNDYLLYINYFGINSKNIVTLLDSHPKLIVDNAQAFYSQPILELDTFYSPRKFFGVPDGGYFYSSIKWDEDALETDISYARSEHLLKRIDLTANAAFNGFRLAEESLKGAPIKKMSNLTRALLGSVPYEEVRTRRLENFAYLHQTLGKYNELFISPGVDDVPMVYPFLTKMETLRARLIDRSIYVATYWPDIHDRIPAGSWEAYLVSNLIPLAIDQRYGKEEMDATLAVIMDVLQV